ncbi:N-acetylneuraminate synthase family protein [Dyadobacter crusticola]|uniref:N-acetylneuraminate synthase family protein n=1 Tax=Dyadobacter crusticola TaxID=292407 RepID=UPI0004E1B90A|nr:N-acetylneuraminate synthase family protein [Dyadobacter crusticola]
MKGIYMICEIGQAHEGSVALAHAYIDAVAHSGVNAIKFQVHIADAESSIYEPFRNPFSFPDLTRMAYWKRMEFTKEQWIGLKRHCEHYQLDFIPSTFSLAAVAMLENMGVSRFKIASGEVENFLMLDRIARLGKEIILSSGMSSPEELDETIAFLRRYSCPISILQCTTSYPTQPDQWGINVIHEFKNRYRLPVGFSDHSGDVFACLAAAASGADLLEFHVTFDKRMPGPDTSSSLTVDQVFQLARGVRAIESAFLNPVDKADNVHFKKLKAQFGKSLAVNKSLDKGHVIAIEDLESKKPAGYGIEPKRFAEILGSRLRENVAQWDFLTADHI